LFLRRLGELGNLWDKLEAEKFLADSDTDYSRRDSTSESDVELAFDPDPESITLSASPEAESDIRGPKIPQIARKNSGIGKQVKAGYSDSLVMSQSKKLKLGIPLLELPDHKPSGRPASASFDAGKIIPVSSFNTNSSRSFRSHTETKEEAVRKLRTLSKARSNLHQLLAADDDDEENINNADRNVIVEVLRTSLKQESLKLNQLKKQNKLLEETYKKEQNDRRLLEHTLGSTRKHLQRKSGNL
jgi:hypothetical protein